ncbi:sigma 54-interacting transcriptional regulator [Paenibacillus thalictri]|uniref:sigma 54-interacting transcriptional regulator n=1 Tax=Paenibacillus thalictri TaxID=2527873 RepID=UPI0013EF043C|nr:sigma 54-interacting transcriptional regulator [Paenibacillus thalictri]
MRKIKVLEMVRQIAPTVDSPGVTADEVAEAAGILRHNASADLNELVREGLLRKSGGRPVRFGLKSIADDVRHTDTKFPDSQYRTVARPDPAAERPASSERLLDQVIGAKGSLRAAVEQLKAAVLYPPHGLPVLLLGPTGSGKSYLAEKMYFYAAKSGRLVPNAPFNVLNCADYAANPQLLLAQLFGYVKGAFTGADQTTAGLVAQSDNGVLFLDEIHRLPPEGQEMLFLLMDRGVYRMLGDGATQRRVSVRLIAATSEDARSLLLKTLLRRFPVVLTLPDVNARPLEERLALIEYFLAEEAARIGVPISVSPLVLVALMTFHASGNVGELHSAVLLGCAKAFLNYVASAGKPEYMMLVVTHLSPQIQLEYLRGHQDSLKVEQLIGVEDRLYMPMPNGYGSGGQSPEQRKDDLYTDFNRRMSDYLGSSLEQDEVQRLIQIDADYYLRRLLRHVKGAHTLPERLLEVVAGFVEEAGKELGCVFEPEVTTGIALHLASLSRTEPFDAEAMLELTAHCSREFGVVRQLSSRLEEGLETRLTHGQTSFLALFLAAHKRVAETERVKVLVIAHGDHTATSMAEVANELLYEKKVKAIDMPLSQSLESTLQIAAQRIKEMGKIKGVLLLVDMGSLTGFGAALERMTGIPVAVIPLVTTAAIVEAARLADNGQMKLAQMVEAVKQIYDFDIAFPLPEGKRLIITTCLTGEGTARKLAAFINEALPADLRSTVLVQAVDLDNGSEISGLYVEGWRGTVIAAVGTVNPHLPGVAFIGMDQILFGSGMKTLLELTAEGQPAADDADGLSKEEAILLASKFVTDYIDSKDGQLYVSGAIAALEQLEQTVGSSLRTSLAVRWVIHLSFALERIVTGGSVMECSELDYLEQHHQLLLNTIQTAVSRTCHCLSEPLPRSEIGYLALIVLPE